MDRSSQAQVLGDQLPRKLDDGLRFAPLNCNHLSAVYRLAAESFPAVWSEKEFAYFLAHENRLCVGLLSDAPEGPRLRAYFLGLVVQGDLDIISIATRVEDRRLGLAERLLRHVCMHQGVARAFLEVEVDNEPAIRLYGKMGFERLGRRHAYYGPNRDAYLMRYLVPSR